MNLTIPDLQEKLKSWGGCELAKNANPVLGEGNFDADIMFVGEAPGKKEDELGRPFVGASGKLLNELLDSIGLQRDDVYISNIVKYRPPNNRDPSAKEKEQCFPWLLQEIEIVAPCVIATLGRHALHQFFPDCSISDVHGTRLQYTDIITIVPLYHPAAALYNRGLRQTLFDDVAVLKELLS